MTTEGGVPDIVPMGKNKEPSQPTDSSQQTAEPTDPIRDICRSQTHMGVHPETLRWSDSKGGTLPTEPHYVHVHDFACTCLPATIYVLCASASGYITN